MGLGYRRRLDLSLITTSNHSSELSWKTFYGFREILQSLPHQREYSSAFIRVNAECLSTILPYDCQPSSWRYSCALGRLYSTPRALLCAPVIASLRNSHYERIP